MPRQKNPLTSFKLMPETVERISKQLLETTLKEMTLPFVVRIGMNKLASDTYERLQPHQKLAFQRKVAASILREAYLRTKRLGTMKGTRH